MASDVWLETAPTANRHDAIKGQDDPDHNELRANLRKEVPSFTVRVTINSKCCIIHALPSAMAENCSFCGFYLPPHLRYCPSCERDAGYPNVRAAGADDEAIALRARFQEAEEDAERRNCLLQLQRFGAAVAGSKAIICRSLQGALSFVSSDNALYNTFYQQVESGARIPEANFWDRARVPVDGTLFPMYQEKIVFGMLSLDNQGSSYHGPYVIVLKESMVGHRASVFEENSVNFFQKRSDIRVGGAAPAGYRTIWAMRDKLAVAKCHSRIGSATISNDFPAILLVPGADPKDNDFIEVHIYGPIHRHAIAGPTHINVHSLLYAEKRK